MKVLFCALLLMTSATSLANPPVWTNLRQLDELKFQHLFQGYFVYPDGKTTATLFSKFLLIDHPENLRLNLIRLRDELSTLDMVRGRVIKLRNLQEAFDDMALKLAHERNQWFVKDANLTQGAMTFVSNEVKRELDPEEIVYFVLHFPFVYLIGLEENPLHLSEAGVLPIGFQYDHYTMLLKE